MLAACARVARASPCSVFPCADKSLIIWEIVDRGDEHGLPKKALRGHNHFVSDVVLSSDGQFALSGYERGSVVMFAGASALSLCVFAVRFLGVVIFYSRELRQYVVAARACSVGLNVCCPWHVTLLPCRVVCSSWDSTLRLWDLSTGLTTKTFTGHTKDVLSVAFSTDNRHIVSASRDKTLRLWNTLVRSYFCVFVCL